MAESTFDTQFVPVAETKAAKPGFVAKFAKKFVEQRTAKARHMTASYIQSFSDEKLAELDLKTRRRARYQSSAVWSLQGEILLFRLDTPSKIGRETAQSCA